MFILDVTTRFDCVFWIGDLNFRIEVYKGKQAVEDIVQYIQEQEHPNFEDLVAGDQLTQLIVEGRYYVLDYLLTHCSLEIPKRVIGRQCRPKSDATKWGV